MPKGMYFRAFCAFRYGGNTSFYGYKQKGGAILADGSPRSLYYLILQFSNS